MSKKVKHYLLIDSIWLAINISVMMLFVYFCSFISYDVIEIIAKVIIIGISVIIDLFIVLFFLLYWWSDIKWTKCKQKIKRMKKAFL